VASSVSDNGNFLLKKSLPQYPSDDIYSQTNEFIHFGISQKINNQSFSLINVTLLY